MSADMKTRTPTNLARTLIHKTVTTPPLMTTLESIQAGENQPIKTEKVYRKDLHHYPLLHAQYIPLLHAHSKHTLKHERTPSLTEKCY